MTRVWEVFAIVLASADLVLSTIEGVGVPPHIITILVDDLGWHDVGYHGTDQIKTPNIDALAYSGTVLARHYVLPTCTPSRSALLTGSHPIKSGMQGYPLKAGENRNLPLSFKLKAAYLKDLGYETHMIGKWHLGYQTYDHVPNRRGFDSFFGYYNGYVDYYHYEHNQTVNKEKKFRGYDMHLNDDVYRSKSSRYATRMFTKRAQDVIRNHDPSKSLYLYFSHLATHTGHDRNFGMQVPETADVNKTFPHINNYGRRLFAGCLQELDRSVGIVMKELQQKRMLENSIVMFMSDNGGHTVSVDMSPNWSSNWPLGGTKFTMYEGSVRGAAVIWSPHLPKGFLNEGFIHITDWLPTLYSAAGGNVDRLTTVDGTDQWDALKNGRTVKRDHLLLNVDEKMKVEGVIVNERWKVIKGGYPGYGNYDLHWGEEDNNAPNPEYNPFEAIDSPTGRAIRTVPGYEDVFDSKRILKLRDKTRVKCEGPKPAAPHLDGFVNRSSTFRCPDYCVFDIINDPCEVEQIQNAQVLQVGRRFLEEYKRKLVPQKPSFVDPMSDPRRLGGVWMPWDFKTCAKSTAELSSQHLNVSLLLTLTWYSFGWRRNRP